MVQDNRGGNVSTAVVLLLTAACLLGCPAPTGLPEDGAHMVSLVRLDGAPVHEHHPTRLRILVAELGMGVDQSLAPARYEPERIEAVSQHAAVYQPDLFIGLDAPFGGPFLGNETPSEALAVDVDRFYRVEARTSIPRRRLADVPVSPATGGALFLSEFPLTVTDFSSPVARPLAPFYFAPFAAEVALGLPDAPLAILVRDGLRPEQTAQGVQVTRGGGECAGLETGGRVPICLQTPESWELLRYEIVDDFAGLGLRAIKAEFRLAGSGPVAPE